MLFIYNIGLRLYYAALFISSFFYHKSKLWWNGRKNLETKMRKEIKPGDRPVWIHCASLGEFEQVRPLIEEIKNIHPEISICITFFSPSGYQIRKNYELADYIYYLPIDFKKKVKTFIEVLNPRLVIFVKYEYWYHYVHQLKLRKIPTYIVSANFREDQIFFRRYGGWFKKILLDFEFIFLQNTESQKLLESNGITHSLVAGDIRFDRVFSTAAKTAPLQVIELFKHGKTVVIGGSTWEQDESVLFRFIREKGKHFDLKFIIAPHIISASNVDRIMGNLENAIRISDATEANISNYSVLVINNMGMLSSLYNYGEIAFIGGGFSTGLHNVLEATTFGLPVFIGPKHDKFPEIKEMLQLGIACEVLDYNSFEHNITHLLTDNNELSRLSGLAKNFILEKKGATKLILEKIKIS